MKRQSVTAWILEGVNLSRGMELHELKDAQIVSREVVYTDPFTESFNCLLDSSTGESVRGHVFFSESDAKRALLTALNPLSEELTRQHKELERLYTLTE